MTAWAEKRLKDVAQIRYGRALPWDQRREGGFPVYGSSGVVGWHDESMVSGPGLIIGRKGNIGTVFYSKGPFWPIDTVYYINQVSPKCHLQYLYYVIQTLRLERLNEDTAVPGINLTTVAERRFLLPGMEDQVAIASAMSALDDKIANGRKLTQTLTAMADAVFRAIFQGPAAKSSAAPLSRFGRVVGGFTPPKRVHSFYGGDVPFVKIPDMRGNVYVLEARETLSQEGLMTHPNKSIPPGAISVSCLATVGLVSLSGRNCVTNQQVNTIIPHDSRHRLYLFCLMRSLSGTLDSMASGGTVAPKINISTFAKMEVPFPDSGQLEQFNKTVKPFFAKMLAIARQRQLLKRIKGIVLPRLLCQDMTLDTGRGGFSEGMDLIPEAEGDAKEDLSAGPGGF